MVTTTMAPIRMKGLVVLLATIACAAAFTVRPVISYNGHRPVTMTPRAAGRLHLFEPTCTMQIAATSSDLSLQNRDVLVFIAGVIPFAWATVEFWRRIAVGEPFGTGKDSVYIGKDNAPSESRGRQTLDRGAFVVAYVLFGLAAGAIGLTLYSVITSAPPENL